MTGSGIHSLGAALVTAGPDELLGLSFLEPVEGLLNRLTNHLVHVGADLALLDLDHARELFPSRFSGYSTHGSPLSLVGSVFVALTFLPT